MSSFPHLSLSLSLSWPLLHATGPKKCEVHADSMWHINKGIMQMKPVRVNGLWRSSNAPSYTLSPFSMLSISWWKGFETYESLCDNDSESGSLFHTDYTVLSFSLSNFFIYILLKLWCNQVLLQDDFVWKNTENIAIRLNMCMLFICIFKFS